MTFVKPSDVSGGASYFKPADFSTHVALLIEPKSIARDVPNTYAGVTKNRDEVTADVTAFATKADLDSGNGVEHKAIKIVHPAMARMTEKFIGGASVARVDKFQFKNAPAPAWVFEDVDGEVEDKVVAYYKEREAALDAAVSAAPGF